MGIFMKKHIVIIVAGGKGKRLPGTISKQYIKMAGKPVILHTIETFNSIQSIEQLIIVLPKQDVAWFDTTYIQSRQWQTNIRVVPGGEERQESVYRGLMAIDQKEDVIVAVHDGVRPFITIEAIEKSYEVATQYGACVVGVPVKDTIKQIDQHNIITHTPDRQTLWQVQTPQTFDLALLLEAHETAQKDNFIGTDDAMLVERIGQAVVMAMGSYRNIKITTADDLNYADFLLTQKQQEESKMRIGLGYDVHKLVEDRALILGGVTVEHVKGLLGHSDADVLVHAIMDALLGAAGLGDIGVHFPDTDAQYKGVSSMVLLKSVVEKIEEKGYQIGNVDAVIMAQKPKLASHIPSMKVNIANVLKVDDDCVNIKATTTEKLGYEGREEGITAQAVVMLIS
jgi:2-C-methyl-D-erythritol 4-phosphate cytidylyltransferase/2-C-methyl-D-erythritol 2,4-cyclodiphosphate synthase